MANASNPNSKVGCKQGVFECTGNLDLKHWPHLLVYIAGHYYSKFTGISIDSRLLDECETFLG